MKRRLIAGAAALLLLFLAAFLYAHSYPVRADNSNLAEYTDHFLNIGNAHPWENSIHLYGSITIGDRKWVLAEINGQLGELRLTKGINGRYRIRSVGYGGGNFREEIIEEGGRKYFLMGGRNSVFGIRRVTVSVEGREYGLDIPEGDCFFVYAEIDPASEVLHSDLDAMRFYNADGTDITEQVPWN